MQKLQAAIKYGEEDLAGAKSLVDQCPADDPDTEINRGLVISRAERVGFFTFLSLLKSGCLLYKEGRYDEALVKFNGAQQVVGYDPHLSYNIALCHYRYLYVIFL